VRPHLGITTTFFFPAIFTRFPAGRTQALTFLFFAASILASVAPGGDHRPQKHSQKLGSTDLHCATITTHYIFCAKFHPHQKMIIAFSLKLGKGKL
jgi:hypothetical protein